MTPYWLWVVTRSSSLQSLCWNSWTSYFTTGTPYRSPTGSHLTTVAPACAVGLPGAAAPAPGVPGNRTGPPPVPRAALMVAVLLPGLWS